MTRWLCANHLKAWLLVAALLVAPQVHAGPGGEPTSSDKAAAQALFDEGRRLLDDESYETACAKFKESQRLDPAVGTQLNLARCYELVGKNASAWINFLEAAARARRNGQSPREKLARKLARDLEPTLSKLTIEVTETVEGLEIARDGALVREAQWGSAVPVDPGEHQIGATAPGYRPWSRTIEIDDDGATLVVTVGPLEPAPAAEPTPRPHPPTPDRPLPPEPEPTPADGSTQRVLGIVSAGVGVAGLIVGMATGFVAINKNDESLEHCPVDPNRCTAEGVELRDDALTAGTVSTVGFVAGGVALVAGAILFFTAPSGPDSEAGGETSRAASGRAPQWRLLPEVAFAPPRGEEAAAEAMGGVIFQGSW